MATGQKFLDPLGNFSEVFQRQIQNYFLYSTQTQSSYQTQMFWVNFSKATYQKSVSRLLLRNGLNRHHSIVG